MGVSVMDNGADAFGAGAESGETTNKAALGDTVQDARSPSGSGADFSSLGPLLEEPNPAKVVATMVGWVREQAPARRRRRAEWECNKLWLRGVRGARVRRQSEDRNDVELVVPLGAYDLPPVLDRVDELLEKMVSHLLSDPPTPDAEPASDNDTDRDAAEFTTRLLTVEGSESGFNNLKLMRRAERKAGVYGSSFLYACIDPTGNGWRPTEIRALPTATNEQDATIDPLTQMPVADGDERLVTRYVKQDGTLSDKSSDGRPQWLPKLVPEVLSGEHVVLIPETCSGIDDADGVIVIRYTPLSKLKATFPMLANAPDDIIQKFIGWRPEESKYARPGFQRGADLTPTTNDGEVNDGAMVCTLSLYFKSHAAYPKGAYIVVGGESFVLHKQPWSGMVETSPGEVDEECLMLPIAQCRQLDDDVDDDPIGFGIIKKIGPDDEVRGQIVLGWLEYLDRFLHPIPMLPLGSIVKPGDIQRRDDTPIYFNPAGKPEWENIPSFPADAKEFFDRATTSQDNALGLGETAQGLEVASVNSGVQAQTIVQQAHVNLTTMRANLGDCQERWWRVVTQIFRVFYTIPQKLKYQGDDGAYKEREWTRIDLGSTRDIRIARGSFTQQSAEQKQANLDQRYQNKLIDGEEYNRLSANNIRSTIGYQDNPHRMRIRREINVWKDGPPATFPQQQARYQAMIGQWQQAAAAAQQSGQPAPQQPPDPTTPFTSRAIDQEQDIARIRWTELRREIAGSSFAKHPPAWQQKILAAYDASRKAAGVMTVAEQQAAAQQQAVAQQRDKQVEQQHEQASAAAKSAYAAHEQAAEHRHEIQRDAIKATAGAGAMAPRAPLQLLTPT